ncbi:hypothetical protein BRC68_00625 [Halobacteriales archaeon QH_6_64_20]|nr:MAG: hypothetical protein BRC68_00625 [Halobacteriales archaeon QH_6_64_20]
MAANPDQFSPIGRVHGDLLVENTIRSEVIDTKQVFAQNIQFTGTLRQTNASNETLFAVTSGGNRKVLIADDNGDVQALLTKTGNLNVDQIVDYTKTTLSAAAGSTEPVPSDVEEYMVVSTENGNRRIPLFLPNDSTPPGDPTNLKATNKTGAEAINLNWNSVSATDLDEYRVYRSLSSGSPYNQIASVDSSSTDYTDSNVLNSETYYYVVTAVDDVGNESGYSNEASATAT